MRIVYKREDGGVSIVVPSDEWGGTIKELAEKVIPKGRKYKIVEDADIPTDRTFRNAWDVNEDDLTDGVVGE